MAANDKQVGGDHYKHPVQHWDWAQYLGYLEGNATKYIGRHDTSKGKGMEDIDKALHYIAKIIEKHYPGCSLDYVLNTAPIVKKKEKACGMCRGRGTWMNPRSGWVESCPRGCQVNTEAVNDAT